MNGPMLIALALSAHYHRANALFQARQFPESLASVEQILKIEPKLVPALILKAKLAMAAKRFDVAGAALEQALSAGPPDAYAQFLYALQFYMANDLQNALPQFEKARRLNPKDARAAQYLGMTVESLGHPAQAMALYEEAARLGPNVDILLTGARLLYLLDRLPACGEWIEQALRLDPNSRDARFENARLLLKRSQPAEAARQAESALKLPPGDTADRQIHYLLVRAYRGIDPTASARHAAAIR